MKLRKKFIAVFLSVAMIATSLQFPAGSVQAEERKEEITQEAVVGEEAENTRENASESTTDTERSSSTSSESTEVTEENSSASSVGTEVPEKEESKEIETSAETMESEEQEEKSESENTEQETKDDESDTCEEESITEEISTEEEETEAEISLNALDNSIAEGSYGNITWSIDADGKLLVEGTGEFSDSVGTERAPWYSYRDNIKSAEINVTEMTNASYMFYGCSKLNGGTNLILSGFDTSNITSMEGMFSECSNLGSVNLYGIDTSNVTNMKNMFEGCIRLSSLNLQSFDTSNVTDMENMFLNCSRLGEFRTLDLGSFNTSKVASMGGMFSGCSSLHEINVSSFDVSGVLNMESMFSACSSLSNINLERFDTSKVTSMESMFSGCESLSSLNLSSFNTSGVISMTGMFSNCSGLYEISLGSFDTSDVTNMKNMFSGCSSLSEIDLSSFDASNVTNAQDLFLNCDTLIKINTPRNLKCDVSLPKRLGYGWYDEADENEFVKLPQNLDNSITITKKGQKSGSYGDVTWNIDTEGKLTVEGTGEFSNISEWNRAPWYGCRSDIKSAEINLTGLNNATGMFYGCNNLTTIDVHGFDTSTVTNMDCMFCGCTKLESVDLCGFDTVKVTSMARMFQNCRNLTSLDVSSFNTQNVGNMSYMFQGCSGLTSLDVSKFNTQNVEDMGGMFWGCNKLSGIDLSNFNTQNVGNMSYMFQGCSGLTGLDLSKFDTQSVTSMSHMFKDCSSLTSIDLSNFNTQNVRDMSSMFQGCSGLTSVDLSELDTQNVTDMSYMFQNCSSLTGFDLKKIDTQSVCDMSYMFQNCSGLSCFDLSDFYTKSITDMSHMFQNCNGLISVDLSNLTINGETLSMQYMFADCSNLASVNWSNIHHVLRQDEHGSINIDMSYMFSGCGNLTDIKLSSIGTVYIEYMSYMFLNCSKLTELDMSNFYISAGDMSYMFAECGGLRTVELCNICRVSDMSNMFYNCASLTNLNINDCNTSNVFSLCRMFMGCKSLKQLDLSSFDTSNVTNMVEMFSTCGRLENLNLSSFNAHKAYIDGMLKDCISLTTINTPYNLSYPLELPASPSDIWYKSDGSVITEVPTELDYSITIERNKVPTVEAPHITANKRKTVYKTGDALNIDDLTVMYYDSDGTIRRVTNFSTNADEIDMSVPGTKTLIVTYNDLEADVTLTVETEGEEQENVTISGIEMTDSTYSGQAVTFDGQAVVTSLDGKDVTESVTLTYSYSGKQADGSDYAVTDKAPVNAGKYKLTVAVSEDNENYTGSSEYTFSIAQAPIEITALDEELVIGSPAPESYQYRVDGLLNNDKLIKEPSFTCNVDTEKVGTYEIIPHDADAGMNYKISYNKGMLTVTENGIRYTVSFDLAGHGTAIAPVKNVRSGSLLEEPKQPVEQGYRFVGWYKDKLCTEAWDFSKDMVESDITLYACWLTESSGKEGADLCIQEIHTQTYTGKAIKPSVLVYSADGTTLLRSGKDYVIKYYNNTEADTDAEASLGGTSQTGKEGDNGFSQKLAYVCITGKGNYEGTVYRNFHIAPVSITGNDGNLANGAVLKYSEQLTVNNSKAQKPFSSLKYKKNMKAGVDFEVKLTALEAYDAGGHVLSGVAIDESNLIPSIPAGYRGSFSLTIKGINNYSGEVSRNVYVSDKAHLMKNVTITLGKNLKNMEYTGQSVTLTPAYYDASTKKYYAIDESGAVSTEAEPNGDNVFTVRIGKEYLIYGKDYTISYTNNCASGSALMTVSGIGDYAGTKDIKFKISGKAFSAKQISVENLQPVMTYTGKAVTQDNVVLKMSGRELACGKDYTVTYKNNLKKGTASIIFKAVEESGYSGSFTKKFRIGAAELKDTVKVIPTDSSGDSIVYDNVGIKLVGTVLYSKEGAKISDRVSLTNGSNTLKEGIDYTVSYVNNKAVTTGTNSIPAMNIKGKGNYSGNLSVQFVITEAPMEGNGKLTVVATATPYNASKADSYQYQPKIKVMDGKKSLSAQNDYVIEYRNCTQSAVKAYLEALKNGTSTEDMKPQAVISAKTGSGYLGSVTTDLTIYEEKLTVKNLYVVVSDDAEQITYNGGQVKPDIMVYYGDSKAVKEAKNANEKNEKVLTDKNGTYCLTKLVEKNDYVASYGSNVIAGKSKGNVTVTGIGMYGGNVKTVFSILRRDVYGEK